MTQTKINEIESLKEIIEEQEELGNFKVAQLFRDELEALEQERLAELMREN